LLQSKFSPDVHQAVFGFCVRLPEPGPKVLKARKALSELKETLKHKKYFLMAEVNDRFQHA
jgi:hypothetical protein